MCFLSSQKRREAERERAFGKGRRGAGEIHIDVIVYIM